MKHIETAKGCLLALKPDLARYIISNDNNITFIMQDKPVSEVGVNGLQTIELLRFIKFVYESLSEKYPCDENEITVEQLQLAIAKQQYRLRKKQNENQ